MVQVSVRELKAKLSEYLRRAGDGESILVTNRGKPIATVVAPYEGDLTIDKKVAELERRGILSRPKRPFRLPPLIPLQGEGPTVSEMMLRDRGESLP
jgi:prevent-host-death family protein